MGNKPGKGERVYAADGEEEAAEQTASVVTPAKLPSPVDPGVPATPSLPPPITKDSSAKELKTADGSPAKKQLRVVVDGSDDDSSDDDFDDCGTLNDFLADTVATTTGATNPEAAKPSTLEMIPDSPAKHPRLQSLTDSSVIETRQVSRKKLVMEYSMVNNYILLETLGTGSHGVVKLCKDRDTSRLFALKIIRKDRLKRRQRQSVLTAFRQEIAIMKKLNHQNVLRLFEVIDDEDDDSLYLVLEYMRKGDLLQMRGAPDDGPGGGLRCRPMQERELWFIFRQVVQGLAYLKQEQIVHGDIKPQNLLVGEDGAIKIADFGISTALGAAAGPDDASSPVGSAGASSPTSSGAASPANKLVSAGGTPAFMAPEVCSGQEHEGFAADVWAVGATMYMLAIGIPPFIAKSSFALFEAIQNDPLEFPADCKLSSELRALLVWTLEKDLEKRATLEQVMQHTWHYTYTTHHTQHTTHNTPYTTHIQATHYYYYTHHLR
jgi:[calcium/calmodulin-dependent protein kinase] kinase